MSDTLSHDFNRGGMTMVNWTAVLAFVVACCVVPVAFCADAPSQKPPGNPAVPFDRQIAEANARTAEALQRLRKLTDEKSPLPANEITAISCANGSVFKPRPDGCFLASGANPEQEVLTLTVKPARAGSVLRLDFPLDDNLPGRGPGRAANGNFVVCEAEIEGISVVDAWANEGGDVGRAIDGITDKEDNYWNSAAYHHRQRTLLLALEKPAPTGAPLTVRLICRMGGAHVPGCISAAVLAEQSDTADVRSVGRAERDIARLENLKVFAVVRWLMGPSPADAPKELQLKPGDSIVAIGDSITDAGGYLRVIDAVLAGHYSGLKIPKVINKGISGQKSEDLVKRFDLDVVQLKPAFVTICIGINDVWHRLNRPHDENVLAAYKENVIRMVDAAQKSGIKVVLLTPTLIEEDPNSEGNRRLAKYVAALKEIAAQRKCQLVDLHGLFLAGLKTRAEVQERGWLTSDGVHMNPLGDALMAAGVLQALGVSPIPAEASSAGGLSFTNTLGMEFVPVKAVPGVLFSRWETRVQDFAAFCKETERPHDRPDFPQSDEHPVVNISYHDATEFCAWLSKKEGKQYRLPTDHDWSGAVGIADKENPSEFPKFKGIERPKDKRHQIEGQFPWGGSWPPPLHSGNFDSSLNADPYDHTSPVGSFEPTADGLYDMAGNVWEWCDSIYEDKEPYRVLRGGCWRYTEPMFLLSAFRGRGNTPTRHDTRGFRVVLELSDDGGQGLLHPTKARPQHDMPEQGTSRLAANLKAGKARTTVQVLLVGGRGSHDWHGFHDTIAPVLETSGDFELRLTPNIDALETAILSNYRVVMFYGPGGDFTDSSQEQSLHDFVRNGGGLVGVHATDAFKKSDVYWRLLGGRFTTHRGGEFMIRIMNKQHPVTAPVEDFKIHDETYANEYHPEFILDSLFRMDRGGEQQSMGWVQNYGKGRVFNTTLGHDDKAWHNEHFQKIVLRGLYWAAGVPSRDDDS